MDNFQKMEEPDLRKAYDELKKVNAELVEALKRSNANEQGKIQSIVGTSHDTTRENEADELLKLMQLNYESFFKTIDDFFFVVDLQGFILYVNDTVVKRLGYSREELSEMHLSMIHPIEQRDEELSLIQKIAKEKSGISHFPLVKKNGEHIFVKTTVNIGVWNGRNVFFGVSKDLSQILLSEEKFSKAFQLNPSACGLSDIKTGAYVELNDSFCRLFGFDREEAIGKTAMELGILSEEVRASILQNSTGVINNMEVDLRAKDGSLKRVLLSADTLYVQDREVIPLCMM